MGSCDTVTISIILIHTLYNCDVQGEIGFSPFNLVSFWVETFTTLQLRNFKGGCLYLHITWLKMWCIEFIVRKTPFAGLLNSVVPSSLI